MNQIWFNNSRSPYCLWYNVMYLWICGSVIYLIFYWKMMIAFFGKRTENRLLLVATVLMITGLALSLFGDSFGNPSVFEITLSY